MSKPQTQIWFPLLAVLVMGGVLSISFAAIRRHLVGSAGFERKSAVARKPLRPNRVQRARLRGQLGWALNELGDRLERPGKERLLISGSLQVDRESNRTAASLLMEFPNRVRLSFSNASGGTIVFDQDTVRSATPLSEAEESLVETLVYDSAEHFFWTQATNQATQFIGSRFRADNGSSDTYEGPFYDIYKVVAPVKISGTELLVPKFFYFNSNTLLLEKVVYQRTVRGVPGRVEVLLTDWRNIDSQRVPHRIERIENGERVFVFSIASLNFASRVDDGIFTPISDN